MDTVIKQIIAAAAEALRTQDQIRNNPKISDKEGYMHICRSYIAKLSNAYHALVLGDPNSDLVDFYTAAQEQKERV